MHISLGEFQRSYGIHKGTVSKRARELGFDTSQGLSSEAVEAMKAEFNVQEQAPTAPTITPEVMPDGFIQSGQLAPVERREIELPQGFDPTAMVRFFDGVAGQATDTASLVAIADLALDAVDRAMDGKIQTQRAELTQSEKDAQALATKMAEAKTRLQVKALESKMLAERQTSATTSAEATFAELMRLGKPAEAPTD
ncbi:MAG: hypothetical protein ACFCVB_18985 [Nodosilinea sp.]